MIIVQFPSFDRVLREDLIPTEVFKQEKARDDAGGCHMPKNATCRKDDIAAIRGTVVLLCCSRDVMLISVPVLGSSL